MLKLTIFALVFLIAAVSLVEMHAVRPIDAVLMHRGYPASYARKDVSSVDPAQSPHRKFKRNSEIDPNAHHRLHTQRKNKNKTKNERKHNPKSKKPARHSKKLNKKH